MAVSTGRERLRLSLENTSMANWLNFEGLRGASPSYQE
jgi:hypothetical protein